MQEFRRGPVPGVFYIPNWITQDEEEAILERVYAVPDDHDLWVTLKHRRLQMWGGEVKAPFEPTPLPRRLTQISQALVEAGVFTEDKKPNHALINGALCCAGDGLCWSLMLCCVVGQSMAWETAFYRMRTDRPTFLWCPSSAQAPSAASRSSRIVR